MMAGKCFVRGCLSGTEFARRQYKLENKKHPPVFTAPKQWTMLQIWGHVIPTLDKKFSATDKICELHFPDEYVSKFHELTLEGGNKVKMARNYAKLKPGAIPTIFDYHPEYSKELQKIVSEMQKEFPLHIPQMDVQLDEQMESYFQRILKIQETTIPKIKPVTVPRSQEIIPKPKKKSSAKVANTSGAKLNVKNRNMSNEDFDMDHEDNSVNSETIISEHGDIEVEESQNEPDDITFDGLLNNLKSVSKPNSSWSVTPHGTFVMCAKWNKKYEPEKRVVIDHELNIRVFVHDEEIAAYNNCISDIADISNILNVLDK